MQKKREGKLLGDVFLTCPSNEDMLEFPTGTPIVEVLSKAAAAFGEGYIIDRHDCNVTSEHAELDGGYYTLWPDGVNDPRSLHVYRKGTGPHEYNAGGHVTPNVLDNYDYDRLAQVLGYSWLMRPKYLILGDPEIMRIYRGESRMVSIDRSKLEDWGTRGKPVPVEGFGWWDMIKEVFVPPPVS